MLSRQASGVLYTGYTTIDGSSEITTITGTYTSTSTWTLVPALAGVKYFFSPKQNFYIAGLLGANFITLKVSNSLGETSESTTEFAGNINFGIELETSENGAVDISAGYVYVSGFNYVGARVAYIFKL